MAYFEILQTANALAGLSVLMYICYRLKRSLRGYARYGSFQ